MGVGLCYGVGHDESLFRNVTLHRLGSRQVWVR